MDIAVAPDFPKCEHMEVERRLSEYLVGLRERTGAMPDFGGYVGAWNAIILRFRAADEDCKTAAEFLARNYGGLSLEERYQLHRPLFGFFANAQSAVECCCFGIYHIGCLKNPGAFAKGERDVMPETASSGFAGSYSSSKIAAELAALISDPTWAHIKNIRRLLFHRVDPGVTIYMTTGSATPPPAEWTGLGVALEPGLVNGPRAWLAMAISGLVGATLDFVKDHF